MYVVYIAYLHLIDTTILTGTKTIMTIKNIFRKEHMNKCIMLTICDTPKENKLSTKNYRRCNVCGNHTNNYIKELNKNICSRRCYDIYIQRFS